MATRALLHLLINLGEFQGKEASEQHIRELCGGMISGESPALPPPSSQGLTQPRVLRKAPTN